MIEQKEIAVGHYPFKIDDDLTKIRQAFGTQYRMLVGILPLEQKEKDQALDTLFNHYLKVEGLGLKERQLRLSGEPKTNLTYHDINHFWQCGFDGATIARYLYTTRRLS